MSIAPCVMLSGAKHLVACETAVVLFATRFFGCDLRLAIVDGPDRSFATAIYLHCRVVEN